MPARLQHLTPDAVPAPLRVQEQSTTLSAALAAARAAQLPVQWLDGAGAAEDFGVVDLTLHVAAKAEKSVPPPGVDYAGMTPGQRRAFLDWAAEPDTSAPPAFRRLYVANLEVMLLAAPEPRRAALARLEHLSLAPAWRGEPFHQHALLLGIWLEQRGDLLAGWLRTGVVDPAWLGIALGQQALLGAPLDAQTLGVLLARWGLAPTALDPDLLKLRLSSLASSLGADPLTYALAACDAQAREPRPWRTAHRGLRLALPQPDLRPLLDAPLRDMLSVPMDVADAPNPDSELPDDESAQAAQAGWNLILEFGHSRSEFFEPVLKLCQRLPGFAQILDEDRRVIYRVTFRKSEMRRFWRIWEYTQAWASTRVYLNGQELEAWKIWPYSQYLR